MSSEQEHNSTRQPNDYERVGEIVSIYQRGSTWWVNYQREGQQRKSLKTTSKKEAKLRALRLEREILTGNFQPAPKLTTIVEVTAAFRSAKEGDGIADTTLSKYDNCIRLLLQLAADLGVHHISKITPAFMDKFRQRRIEELKKRPGRDGQKTASNDLVTIRGIIKFALARKLLQVDPLAGYKIKKAKTKPQPYWVQDELELILNAAHLR